MAQDTTILGESITVAGPLKSDQGHISSDGVVGNLTTVGVATTTATVTNFINTGLHYGGVSGATGAALAISGTIATAKRVTKVTPTSAVTACIATAGTQDGQELTIMNLGAAAGSSITFATAGSAAGSSNLATDFVISGLTCAKFVWDITSATWFPAVN